MTDWQPIETAPKDGTEILLFNDDGVHKAAWLNDTVPSYRRRKIFDWCVPGSWQDEQGGHFTIQSPTHWMPLPDQPRDKP